jgi:hypothetical protein
MHSHTKRYAISSNEINWKDLVYMKPVAEATAKTYST